MIMHCLEVCLIITVCHGKICIKFDMKENLTKQLKLYDFVKRSITLLNSLIDGTAKINAKAWKGMYFQ